MGRTAISTNMTLDGVVQDPDGREGSPVGGLVLTDTGVRTSTSGRHRKPVRR